VELAKFGYRGAKKAEKIKESCHILVTSWKLFSRYADFRILAGKKRKHNLMASF
jgi:hypothetical protein